MIRDLLKGLRARWKNKVRAVKASAEFWRLAGALVASLGVALSDRALDQQEREELRDLLRQILREVEGAGEEAEK